MVPSSTNNYMPKFSSVQDFQEMGPSSSIKIMVEDRIITRVVRNLNPSRNLIRNIFQNYASTLHDSMCNSFRLEEDCSTSVINFGHSETSNRHSCFDKYTILIHQWVATHII
ncbi:hypothetical protein S245_008037 [Arachis hypogaea]